MDRLVMTASSVSVSELKSNRKYLSISMRMFSTRANLNKCAVTEAFIDDIVANKNDYVCMGLYADVTKLKKKDYRGLTHMYDPNTNTFYADQVGSFYDFEKVEDEYGISLIGYARVAKRSDLVCEAIQELYNANALNFSFEISAGVVDVVDGITIVDANEENELTGMAIVSVPAYPESKALELVAENKHFDDFYATANVQISEVDYETVRMKFYDAYHCYMESLDDYHWDDRTLMFCRDCVIIYRVLGSNIIKVEYAVSENGDVMILDVYDVELVRTKGCEEVMENEKIEVTMVEAEQNEAVVETEENVVTVVEAESEAETVEVAENAESEASVEVAEDKAEPEEEEVEEKEDELEMAKKRCAELEAKIEELEAVKAELDAIRAEQHNAEIEAKKSEMRKYAQAEGLDVNNDTIAEAIENMNYEALVAEVIANKSKVVEKVEYVASYSDIKVEESDRRSYLFEDR